MGPYRILIADLNPVPCPADNCGHLPELIASWLPGGQIHVQTTNTFPTEATYSSPDIIVLRPSLEESVDEITRCLRKKCNKSSILGLLCGGWDNPKDIYPSLVKSLDDFLTCPFREIDIFPRIQRLLHWKNETAIASVAKAIKEKLHLEVLVGESECFLQAVEKIPALAYSNATVMIYGETGTGKELFARAIHYHSPRQSKPFIPVNCGALPDHLFENELFGHVRGAFTDASSAEKGLIAEAEGGTLILDEVDTLSPSAQVKLLRFLQDGEYRPLGSSQSVAADVRIIAATNTELRRQVELKLFREDLYYRLDILSLSIPPLRERLSDISYLASHFLNQYASQYGRKTPVLSQAALQKFMVYSWPGNVRELEGVIQRAIVLCSSAVLQPEDIELPLPYSERMSERSSLRAAKSLAIGAFERGYLASLLAAHRGNVTQAAKAAGKERRVLQRLLQKYSLDRRSFQI